MRKRSWLVLIAACALLLIESVTLIQTRVVEDDNWYSIKAWNLASDGRIRMSVFPFDPEYVVNVITTLHTEALGAMFAVFGLGISQARLLSAIFVIALVIVVYYLACDIAGEACGLIAAVLTATDSFLVVAARTARPEAENALLCWLALLLFERALTRHSVKLGFAAGLICGLGLICHPMTFPFFAAMVLFCGLKYGRNVWREPVAQVVVAGVALVLAPYLGWCFSDAPHIAAFHSGYLERISEPGHHRMMDEAIRWLDFIGVSSQRVPLLPHVPIRLHIALIVLVALAFFARRDRRYGLAALALFGLIVGWLFFMVNKSPRYLSILSPLFAIALAYMVAKAGTGWYKRFALAALVLFLLTQLGGNVYWLYRYRRADYADVTRQLRNIVPAGASVYGITTFWFALHDHTYYAWDRTDLDRAAAELHPEYMILYDRVMMHGSGHGDDTASFRNSMTTFVRAHGTLAGRVSNDFYGDMEVYHITY